MTGKTLVSRVGFWITSPDKLIELAVGAPEGAKSRLPPLLQGQIGKAGFLAHGSTAKLQQAPVKSGRVPALRL